MPLNRRKQKQINMHKQLAEKYALRYAPHFARVFQEYWNRVLLEALPPDAVRVYDCGCGTGILLRELRKYKNAVGSDLSFEMLLQAPRGIVCVGDAESIPICASAFNAVIVRGVLHHLSDVSAALREIDRILTPGGMLIVSEPCNDAWIVRAARKFMYRRSEHFSDEDVAFRTEELSDLITRAGFQVVKTRRFGYLAYTLAGFPDVLPLLHYVPFASALTKLMIQFDRLVAYIPGFRRWGLHLIIVARSRTKSNV